MLSCQPGKIAPSSVDRSASRTLAKAANSVSTTPMMKSMSDILSALPTASDPRTDRCVTAGLLARRAEASARSRNWPGMTPVVSLLSVVSGILADSKENGFPAAPGFGGIRRSDGLVLGGDHVVHEARRE